MRSGSLWLLMASLLPDISAGAAAAAPADPPSAQEILRAAEEALFPASTVMRIVLTDHRPKTNARRFGIEVKAARTVGGLLSFLSPPTEVGKRYLFKDHSVWISIPGLPNAIRVSSKEAFMDSTFANNDLMDTGYSDDYDVVLESVGLRDSRPVFLLSCAAKAPQVAYHRIRMSIDRETFIPTEFEFFTRSGLLLKTCRFGERKLMAGRLRATRIEMRDASSPETFSVIEIALMTSLALPRSAFSIENAGK